jgi:hypothetical protein
MPYIQFIILMKITKLRKLIYSISVTPLNISSECKLRLYEGIFHLFPDQGDEFGFRFTALVQLLGMLHFKNNYKIVSIRS